MIGTKGSRRQRGFTILIHVLLLTVQPMESKVGFWEERIWRYHGNIYWSLNVLPGAERIVFTALGLSISDEEGFVSQEGTRRTCLWGIDSGAKVPEVEVVLINLHHLNFGIKAAALKVVVPSVSLQNLNVDRSTPTSQGGTFLRRLEVW
jgi:hypothetical protein